MSGFEVVGVILGVMPILTSGLKRCETKARVILRYDEVMGQLISALQYEHLRFRNWVEKLVIGLVDDQKLEDLFHHAAEKTWAEILDEGGLESKLKGRLGRGYGVYVDNMTKLQMNLTELGTVLGLKSRGKEWYERWTGKPGVKTRTWKKVRHCLDHSEHQRLLANISECNTRLEHLALPAPDAVIQVTPKTNKADFTRLEAIRFYAESLYCALCSHWLCNCKDAHATHFRLVEVKASATKSSHRFKMGFMLPMSIGSGNAAPAASVTWREAEFETLEEEEEATTQGQVSFSLPTPSSCHRWLDKRIENLCLDLNPSKGDANKSQQLSTMSDAECIGFIVQKQHKHYIFLPQQPLPKTTTEAPISLHQLLVNKGKLDPLKIELVDKYELALLLASSLLQLQTTSWLKYQWSTEDIHFVPTKRKASWAECTVLTKSFPLDLQSLDDTPTRESDSHRQIAIRNEAIWRLGATLVELSALETLQSQQTEGDRAIPSLADYETAQRISKEIESKKYYVPEWDQVVSMCLRCGFHASPDFGDEKFRREFYEYVVGPLQKLYDDAQSTVNY